MNYEEAIKILNDTPVTIQGCCSTREYHEVMHLAENAMLKQIPSKPKNAERCSFYGNQGNCPTCDAELCDDNVFCHRCGQALDWEIVK